MWTQTFTPAARESTAVIKSANFFFAFFAIQIVVYGAGSILSGLLNAHREYLWPSLGPVFNNLVVIAVFLSFAWMTKGHPTKTSLVWLAAGTTLGVVAMYVVQIPSLKKTGVRLQTRLRPQGPRPSAAARPCRPDRDLRRDQPARVLLPQRLHARR